MNHEVGRVSPSAPTPTVANGAMRTSRPTDPAGSWSQCVVAKPWRLSMNLPSPGLRPPSPLLGRGEGRVREGRTGSWPQCMRKNERGLSMNFVAADVRRLVLFRLKEV